MHLTQSLHRSVQQHPKRMAVRPEDGTLCAGKILKTKLREPFWLGRERAVA